MKQVVVFTSSFFVCEYITHVSHLLETLCVMRFRMRVTINGEVLVQEQALRGRFEQGVTESLSVF